MRSQSPAPIGAHCYCYRSGGYASVLCIHIVHATFASCHLTRDCRVPLCGTHGLSQVMDAVMIMRVCTVVVLVDSCPKWCEEEEGRVKGREEGGEKGGMVGGLGRLRMRGREGEEQGRHAI